MIDVVRELAENPNVHQPLLVGRELYLDPAGRFAIFFVPGTLVQCATVQRVRLKEDEVAPALQEIRALLRARAREGAEWELGDSTTPNDLVERLLQLGLRRDVGEPFVMGLVLRGTPAGALPPEVTARRVRSVDELRAAWTLQRAAFHDPRPIEEQRLASDFAREGAGGATFLAFVRRHADRRGLRRVYAARVVAVRRRHRRGGARARRLSRAGGGPCTRSGRAGHAGAGHARGAHVASDPRAPGLRADRAPRSSDRPAGVKWEVEKQGLLSARGGGACPAATPGTPAHRRSLTAVRRRSHRSCSRR